MSEERVEFEYSGLSEFAQLVTSSEKHLEAYSAFSIVAFYRSMARKGHEKLLEGFIADRRQILERYHPELLDAYTQLEEAFDKIGVEEKDVPKVLLGINKDERLVAMATQPCSE